MVHLKASEHGHVRGRARVCVCHKYIHERSEEEQGKEPHPGLGFQFFDAVLQDVDVGLRVGGHVRGHRFVVVVAATEGIQRNLGQPGKQGGDETLRALRVQRYVMTANRAAYASSTPSARALTGLHLGM